MDLLNANSKLTLWHVLQYALGGVTYVCGKDFVLRGNLLKHLHQFHEQQQQQQSSNNITENNNELGWVGYVFLQCWLPVGVWF